MYTVVTVCYTILLKISGSKYSSLVAHVDYPSTLLPEWQKHLPHKLHSQPHLPMETTGYGKQPLITRLCPLHVHKHGFIIHNRFITINCWSAVHYDISLQRTSLQRYIVVIYRFCFRRYRCNEVSLEGYLGEISWRLYRYLDDLSF